MDDKKGEPARSHQPGYCSQGATDAERYLKRLCDRSFLSLWSYASIFRDQGKTAPSGDGKEVCDLLVIFQDDVIIFSDKDCAFPDTGRSELDWCRWFRKAILQSADQVWGAERWIKTNPNRLYLDRRCTQPFPIQVPDPSKARFHRIVVAHDSARRCRQHFGRGTGSLMLMPRITGIEHITPGTDGFTPFAVGQIDPAKGYMHILDDTTLDILMTTLDTITDFVSYLTKKETLINSGRLLAAAGEEDLLAFYLAKLNDQGEHDFVLPGDYDGVGIDEGHWEEFVRSPQRRAQLEADEVSYSWDALIEKFTYHAINGTSYSMSHQGLANQEKLFRLFARERRTRRRMLAKAIIGLIEKTPRNQRGTRLILPSQAGDPYYVFAVVPHLPSVPYEEYREVRRKLLEALCMVAKLKFPDALDILGIATEVGIDNATRSEDAVYLNAREWNDDLAAEAKSLQEELGLLESLTRFQGKEYEFPSEALTRREHRTATPTRPKSLRNSPCPCGSGKKFKNCCKK